MTISIITPSYNQASFLPYAIESVSCQSYAPFEHLVFDPGSSDGSREIAANYQGVTLFLEPDHGQADAVNKGFSRAKGDIVGWLNSDDLYASPSVFQIVIDRFSQPDSPDIVYGLGQYIDAEGKVLRSAYVNSLPNTFAIRLQKEVGILQPAVFIRKSAVDLLGPLSKDLSFCMDYEYWIRAVKSGLRFAFVNETLALARYYPDNKTWGQRGKSYHEVCQMLKSHYGYVPVDWLQRYAEFRVKGHDGILKNAVGDEISDQSILKDLKRLLHAFNGNHSSIRLLSNKNPPSHLNLKPTITAMQQAGLPLCCMAQEVSLQTKAVPNKVCHTVGTRRWAFDRAWKDEATLKSAREFQRIRARRNKDICVIVGNGPTLNFSDLSLLDNADVFISNYAFLNNQLAKAATYFTIVNNLVAEQGSAEISLFQGPQKFFPYWLRYCLTEDESTFFVNSVGFDKFSTNIEDNISWRSTVTFFNLQLAYGLGYRKILMIGFDHYYKQNPTAKEGDVIDCQKDDDNHFDKSYFKNKVWHAADVGNMEKMYLLAKAAYEADGREIVNCTVGGHLEVFRRGDLEQELKKARGASRSTARLSGDAAGIDVPSGYPRLLMIDSTPVEHVSATGQLKKTMLGRWPEESFLQVWATGGQSHSLHSTRLGETIEQSRQRPESLEQIAYLCREFRPDAIYFRPVDSPLLMEAATKVIDETKAPFALHIMDDWPERLRQTNPELFSKLDTSLRGLIDRASVRWSICDKMSKEYLGRYGQYFEALANGVDLADFPAARDEAFRKQAAPIKVRYLGALAKDMTFESVMDIACAVADLQKETPIELHIHTMDWCIEAAKKVCAHLPGVTVTGLVPWSEYHKTVADSDILLIAYNFDSSSINYTKLSLANKMPECLASGAALFAYGPTEVATIDYLKNTGCACVVDKRDSKSLRQELLALATDGEKRGDLIRKARDFATKYLSKSQVQERFRAGIVRTADSALSQNQSGVLLGSYSRAQAAHYDETDAIADFLNKNLKTGVLIDVGAHHGRALDAFLEKNWKIWAFEPDHKNRAKLEARLSTHRYKGNVNLDTRCVSNKSERGVAFYQSEESTGISGLSAFRDTHKEAQRVDTVSLSDFFQDREMPEVDFLKIDTEGHDLFVLQGFPWERNRPKVIECEFEDLKSKPLGYITKDMADFLVGKGYTVYVSEWHPILRYGQRHDWHRLMKYPCELACPEAWGNLLAFSAPPDEKNLIEAIQSVLKTTPDQNPSSKNAWARKADAPEAAPCYSPTGPNRWLYTKVKTGKQNLLTFRHPAARSTANREYHASLRVVCDTPIKLAVTLARHDPKRTYEGKTLKVDLLAGKPWSTVLKHRFLENHPTLKLQFEILECPKPSCTLEIQEMTVQEVPATRPEEPVLLTPNSFAQANKLYREGKFAEAHKIYLALQKSCPELEIYKTNAQMALRRLAHKSTQ